MGATINELRDLGYTVGVAFGGVDAEQAALERANEGASPAAIGPQAAEITRESLAHVLASSPTPIGPDERAELASQIATAVLDGLVEVADGKVAFQTRALEHAQSSPTVWHVSGFDVSTYVTVDDASGAGADEAAQELLDSLATAARPQ